MRRHPHVFPEGTLRSERSGASIDEAQIKANWEAIKQQERDGKARTGVLDDIPRSAAGAKPGAEAAEAGRSGGI